MDYKRHQYNKLKEHFSNFKQSIVLLGARQTGKTTLLKNVFPNADYLLVDNENVRLQLEKYDISVYKQILGNSRQIIIDELHLLSDPGRAVKILYDQIPGLQIIVTGSSALHIKNRSAESMAGRKIEYQLFPLTFSEYLVQKGIENELNYQILDNILDLKSVETQRLFSPKSILDEILLYGLYPETLNLVEKQKYLKELADGAIFKDILELDLIDNRAKALELLKVLAFQVGNLINYSEIARKIGIDRRSVERYIQIFEESYILFRIYPYSQNKRDEIGKTPKIYFHDLGLRNALIGNFNQINLRNDMGQLFENFVISEIKKIIAYTDSNLNINYWRTKSGSEVDIVLSDHQELYGVEVKTTKIVKNSPFTKRYPDAKFHTVTTANFY